MFLSGLLTNQLLPVSTPATSYTNRVFLVLFPVLTYGFRADDESLTLNSKRLPHYTVGAGARVNINTRTQGSARRRVGGGVNVLCVGDVALIFPGNFTMDFTVDL